MKSTRNAAIEVGERYYFTGQPCIHGHYSKRHTMDGACYECRQEWGRKNRQRAREAIQQAQTKKGK